MVVLQKSAQSLVTSNRTEARAGLHTDTNGTNNYTLAYDAAGNMTDGGGTYKYEYDAFYRLRKIGNRRLNRHCR